MNKIRKITFVTLAALSVGSSVAQAAELVTTNAGFELGSLAGWIPAGSVFVEDAINDPTANVYTTPTGSSWVATFSGAGSLSRTIATSVGDHYTFSFWLLDTSTFGEGQFAANFGSTQVFNQANGFVQDAWTQFSYDVIASSAVTTITLSSIANENAFFGLDNVSVTSVSAVPEPGTLGMMLFGLAGLGVLSRRQKALKN